MKADPRLDSWKAIAAYLGRTTRTVQRWEREEGLPVRRHLHQTASSVFAFADEIDAWARTRLPRKEGVEDGSLLVGRQSETQWLQSQLDASQNSAGARLACVSGEPGIGKTALVDHFLRWHKATCSKMTVLSAVCPEGIAGLDPYLPFCYALRRLALDDPQSKALLADRAPDWSRAVLESHSGQSEPAQPGLRSLRLQMTAFVDGMCDAGPAVIWFDDLHLVDQESLDLVAHLLTELRDKPLLVLGCFRASDMPRRGERVRAVFRELRMRRRYEELTVGPLNRDAIDDYLEGQFPAHGFPSWFVDSVYQTTEGLPLFVSALTHHFKQCGLIAREADGWRLATTTRADFSGYVPDSMQAMIDRTLARLNEQERTLLETASVQGQQFDSAVLSQATQIEIDAVEDVLERVVEVHRVINQVDRDDFKPEMPNRSYEFAHGLYHRAFSASLGEPEHVEISGRVAEALESCYLPSSDLHSAEIAALWERAGHRLNAARWFVRAVERSERMLAYEGVSELAARGLNCLDRSQGQEASAIRARLQVSQAIHSMLKVGPEIGGEHLREAEGAIAGPENGTTHFQLLAGQFMQAWWNFDLLTVDTVLAQMRSLAASASDAAMLAEVDVNSCLASMDVASSLDYGIRAIEALEQLGDAPRSIGRYSLLTEARLQASWYFALKGKIANALECRRRAHDSAAADEALYTGLNENSYGSILYWLLGDYVECLVHATETIERSQATKTWVTVNWGVAFVGVALSGLGKVQEGVRTAERAASAVEPTVLHVLYLTVLAESCVLAGDINVGLTACEEAAAIMENKPWPLCYSSLHRCRALLLHKAGRRQDALKSLNIATCSAEAQRAPLLELRAAMSALEMADDGGRERAVERLRATLAPFEHEPSVPVVRSARDQLRQP